MKKSLLLASLAIISSSVLGISEKRGFPTDGSEERQQVRRIRVTDPREEASSSNRISAQEDHQVALSSKTTEREAPALSIQNVRNNQDVQKLVRYLFDLAIKRGSASEVEREAITERVGATGISRDVEDRIFEKIESIREEASQAVTEEQRRWVKKSIVSAMKSTCRFVRIQANVMPDAIDWKENNNDLRDLNSEMKDIINGISRSFPFVDPRFSIGFQIININGRSGLVGFTTTNQSEQKANIVRFVAHNQTEIPETVNSRIITQDNNWDIIVPQFENGQVIDKSYRIVNQDGRIEYETLKFLYRCFINLQNSDPNLDNLLFTILCRTQNEQIEAGNEKSEELQRQNAFLTSFILREIESDNIQVLSPLRTGFDYSLFGLTLNNDKQNIAQLQMKNKLLNSIIKENRRFLKIRNATIDKVPDEIFGVQGINSIFSTVAPSDIPMIKVVKNSHVEYIDPREKEMIRVPQDQPEDENLLLINYTEAAVDRERKKRIRKTKKELCIIEDDLYRNAIVDYLNHYKNQFVTSKNDLEKIVNRNQKEELEKTWQLKNLLWFLQARDSRDINLDNVD